MEISANSIDENGGEKKYFGGGMDSSQRDRDVSDRIPPPPPLEVVPSSPSASGSTPTWNPSLKSVKIDQLHKGVTTTTTADGESSSHYDMIRQEGLLI